MAAPEVALQARQRGAVAALQEHAAPLPDPVDLARAVQALHRVVAELEPAGRALGAANAELPAPADPPAALWQAATVLREYRGDGHFAVLTAHGVNGCQSHVLRDAADGSRSLTQAARGFTDDEWAAATTALQARGVLAPDGSLTADGQLLRDEIETRTDQLCAPPWRVLSGDEMTLLDGLLGPLATRLAQGAVPYPNPVGAPAPPGRG